MTDEFPPRPPLQIVDDEVLDRDVTRAASRVVLVSLDLEELVGGVPEPGMVAALIRAGAEALASMPCPPSDLGELLHRSHVVERARQIADGIDDEVRRVVGNRQARRYDLGVLRGRRKRKPEPEPAS